jgi:hypothetical protein
VIFLAVENYIADVISHQAVETTAWESHCDHTLCYVAHIQVEFGVFVALAIFGHDTSDEGTLL